VVSATDNPAWATDLVFGDHFIFGTSGLAAPPGIQSCKCRRYGVRRPARISFFGTAFSEPVLNKIGLGIRGGDQIRAKNLPTFAPLTPYNNIQGTTLRKPPRKTAPMARCPTRNKKTPHHL